MSRSECRAIFDIFVSLKIIYSAHIRKFMSIKYGSPIIQVDKVGKLSKPLCNLIGDEATVKLQQQKNKKEHEKLVHTRPGYQLDEPVI